MILLYEKVLWLTKVYDYRLTLITYLKNSVVTKVFLLFIIPLTIQKIIIINNKKLNTAYNTKAYLWKLIITTYFFQKMLIMR